MPASITGSDITLTGVEASPAVLSTIAGVVTSTQGVYTVYDLGDRRLIIAGTLTHDPELHLIRTGANSPQNTIDIVAGGVYNYGVETTVNGALRRSKAMGLMITSTNLVACCADGGFTVRSGGTFNMRGGQILINSCIAWPAGANVFIRDGRLTSRRGALIRLRQSNAPDINGLTLDGGISLDQFAVPIQLKAFQPEFGERALELISGASGGTSSEVTYEGYKSSGLVVDGSNWNSAAMLFLNCIKGSGISVRSNNQNSGFSAVTRIMQDLSVTASQLGTGTAIAGAQLYARDVNNGQRVSRTSANGTVYNFVTNQIYQATSDAAGLMPTQRILTAVVWSNIQGSSDNSEIIKDYRTKTTDGQDILDVHVFGYLHTAQTLSSVVLKADGIAVKAGASLSSDSSVSESVSATVNSYASIDTLDKLYDRAKLWKLQNLALEVPTVLGLPITANGTALDLGAFSLAVDSAAAANLSITGSVITIKAATLAAGTKFTSFKTTGTVTTASATVNVPFTDSTGNSYLQFESIDTWQVYSSAARTTLLGAGTGAQLFKFNFAANTSYFLNLVASGEEFRKTAVPAAAGATLVSLSSTALLTALNAKAPSLLQIEASQVLATKADVWAAAA